MTTLEKDDKEYLNKGNSIEYKYSRDPLKTKIQQTIKTQEEYAALVNTMLSKIRDVDSQTKMFCKGFINLINVFINYLELIEIKNNDVSICELFYYIVKFLKPTINRDTTQFGGTVTYENRPSAEEKYKGNDVSSEIIQNVIIIGAGPNGLYMAISLKKMAPDLQVVVLENRIDEQGLRSLERTRGIYLKTDFDINYSGWTEGLKRTNLVKPEVDYYMRHEWDLFNIGSENDGNFIYKGIFEKKYSELPIHIVEYNLAKYAQSIGILIYHTRFPYPHFANEKTIGIFDATGGRLENIEYMFRVDGEKQLIGDGLNINSLNFHEKIPIISIGDSLFKNNYENGCGTSVSFTMCFFISFIFTLAFKIQIGHESKYLDFFEGSENSSSSAASGGGGFETVFRKGGSKTKQKKRKTNRKRRTRKSRKYSK